MDTSPKKNISKNIIIIILSLVIVALITMIIILYLQSDDNTKPGFNQNGTTELYPADTEEIPIDTAYGKLYFPKQWDDNLIIKNKTDNGIEVIEFWTAIKGKDHIHIFDIVFGGDGSQYGIINTGDGNKVSVSIVSYDFNPDATWTTDEKNIVYMMSEDINYLLLKLNSIEGFEISN